MAPDRIFHAEGRHFEPRKGPVIVNVLCPGRDERVGVVRLHDAAGPILWLRSPDSEVPDRSFALDEAVPELRCPLCGVLLQMDAVRKAVEDSKGRSGPTVVNI